MKKKLVITAALTAALMAAGAIGGTIAYFTSEAKTDISITAGIVKVEANVELVKATSLGVERTDGTFENGGTYDFSNAVLTLEKMTPGDAAVLKVVAQNSSNVNIKWRIKKAVSGELAAGLQYGVYTDAELTQEASSLGTWSAVTTEANLGTYYVVVSLPEEAGNEYQNKSAQISLVVEAVQGNKETPEDLIVDETNHTVVIGSTDGWQEFASNVDAGNKYTGYAVSLAADLDFAGKQFEDVGYYRSAKSFQQVSSSEVEAAIEYVFFDGSFDGQGHTISNITKTYDAAHAEIAGVFAYLGNGSAKTLKNVNLKNIKFLNAYRAGGFIGNGGTCAYTLENVSVENVEIETVRQSGGIVGASYGAALKNLSAKNVKITAQPFQYFGGSYDDGDKVGGIIGFVQADSSLDIIGCTVENVELVGYKDIGAIAGMYGYSGSMYVQTFKDNVVKGEIKLTADQQTHHYEDAKARVDGADVANTDFYGASDLHIAGVGRVGGKAGAQGSEHVDADVTGATYIVNLLR